MKKILFSLLLVLTPISSNANSSLLNRKQTKEMYDFSQVNLVERINTPAMSSKKKTRCEKAMQVFTKEMSDAFLSKNRKKDINKAINKNINKMYLILDEKEYKSYIKIINEEFSKRGIEWF